MRNLGDWQGWLRVPSIWKSIRQAPSHRSALSSLNKSCCTRRGTSLRAGPRDDWQKYKGRMKEMKYQDTMTPTLRLDTLTPTLRLASLVLAAIGFMFILYVTAQTPEAPLAALVSILLKDRRRYGVSSSTASHIKA